MCDAPRLLRELNVVETAYRWVVRCRDGGTGQPVLGAVCVHLDYTCRVRHCRVRRTYPGVITVPKISAAGRSGLTDEAIDYRMIGNVLLSNTTVFEASRLVLSSTNEPKGDHWEAALRACDLMSLIDAVVLHERIFCLPATLPDDVDELELRNV